MDSNYPAGIESIFANRKTRSYLVVFAPYSAGDREWFPILELNDRPTNPQSGVGLRDSLDYCPTGSPDDDLIGLDDLPAECRRCVESDLREYTTA